ncbi:MAG: hypothetical protein D6748_09620 [Calditrichaeota bacterium]|nr:MAG: hypothetical protein D6748_09620 [Calditrichota bacterium]
MRLTRYYHKPEFWAILLAILGGLGLLLQRANISVTELGNTYWPVIFIVFGIVQFFSPRYRDVPATILLLLVGTILLLIKTQTITVDQLRQFSPQQLKDLFLSLFDLSFGLFKNLIQIHLPFS